MEQWIPHKKETWPWIYGRLKRDCVGQRYLGYWNDHGPVLERVALPKGIMVRIVMVSRLGDVGVTDNLEDARGYILRVSLEHIERDYEYTGPQKSCI